WYGAFHPRGLTELTLDFVGLPPLWLRVWAGVEDTWEQQLLLEPGGSRELTLDLRVGTVQLQFPDDLPNEGRSVRATIHDEGRVRPLHLDFEESKDFRLRVPAGPRTLTILGVEYRIEV